MVFQKKKKYIIDWGNEECALGDFSEYEMERHPFAAHGVTMMAHC